MNYTFMKRAILAAGIAGLLTSATANAALISSWTGTNGGSGSWATAVTVAPTAGWDTATAPNGIGDTAQFITPITTANATTVQNTAGPTAVTVGTINYGASNNMGSFSWTITNTNGIILNQDGPGLPNPGFATISNSSTNTSTNNALIISTGTLTLADDLHITNTTTGSTANGGAIQLATALAGTGNITFNSSQAIDTGMTATRAQGAIRLGTAAAVAGYTGNSTIEKGLVVLAASNALGTAVTNTITLGAAVADSASLMLQGTTLTIPNNIVVAAGNTGTRTLGAAGNAGAFNGTITLNSDLIVTNTLTSTDFVNLNGKITGTGGLIKNGVGTVSITATKPAVTTNDYAGDTVINAGTFSSFSGVASSVTYGDNAIPDGPGKGNLIINGTAVYSMSGSETINGLSGSGFVQPTTLSGAHTLIIGSNDISSTFSGVIRNTPTGSARTMSIGKTGAGTLTLSGANTYTGTTSVLNGTLLENGSHTLGGTYTVSSGATLGGTGSIGTSAVAVSTGGFLSPGASIESLDVGSVNGAGTLLIEYDGDELAPIDLLNVAGNFDVSSMVLDFNNIDGLLAPLPMSGGFGTGAYVFAKYGSLTGAAFASVSDLPAGYYVNYAYNDGVSSNNIAVVPEPATLLLAGTGLVALGLIRKRRMK